MRIGVMGINHKLADLKLRELLAKAFQRRFAVGNSLHKDHFIVLLSTCNRTEAYFSSDDLAATHTYLLNILRQEIDLEFDQKLYSYFGFDAFLHLCRVTAGLDSAIVAETEVQGQVKNAYEIATEALDLPEELHYLFQKALKIGKQVRTELDMGRGMPDIEHAVFAFARESFEDLARAKILFVGVSEINRKILNFFCTRRLPQVTICNRSAQHALDCAKKYQLQVLPWEHLSNWPEYDCVIFGTKAPEFLARPKDLKNEKGSRKLIVDLCVPRNVDPSLSGNPRVQLLNIDQLNSTLQVRKERMTGTLNQAEQMVVSATKQHVYLFQQRMKQRTRLNVIGF